MQIKLNVKIKGSSSIYIVKDSSIINKHLTDKENEYLSACFKKKIVLVSLPRSSYTLFILRITSSDNASSNEEIRQKGAELTHQINALKIKAVSINNLIKGSKVELYLAEGLAMANYQFLKYFNPKKKKENSFSIVNVESDLISKDEISKLNNLVVASFFARNLVNEPVSFLTAEQMSKEFESCTKDSNLKIKVYDQKKIKELKMGGLLSVNKGSVDPATFTILEWNPKNAINKKPIIFVGKGVVYDTGGLSLKPTPNSMDIMKCDMGGAAAVAGAIFAIAKSKLPIHIIALVPATDNRPGGNAYAPGDVITMYDKTTVEVLNTDAEGRLILADALSYAKKYDPELVLDAATLTGSALRAIGDNAAVVMGTASEKTFSMLELSGDQTHERIVRFPLWDEYAEDLKSYIADIKNLGGANAGAISAGKFLEHFTDYPWIHIDIAGPAWKNTSAGYLTKGGTGYGVRLLYNFITNYIKSKNK